MLVSPQLPVPTTLYIAVRLVTRFLTDTCDVLYISAVLLHIMAPGTRNNPPSPAQAVALPAASLPPPASASADEKLNFLMAKMCEMSSYMSVNQEKVSALEARADAVEEDISDLRSEVTSIKSNLEASIINLQSELISVKTTLNVRDQQLRSKSVKLSGLPFSEDEASSSEPGLVLAETVYARILCPILNAAVEAGAISYVPTLGDCIDEIYRLNSWPNKPSTPPGTALAKAPAPPTVIIKLFSPAGRLALLRFKRDNTPSPSAIEKSQGSVGFYISEDLTPSTFKLLRDLQKHQKVDKAWTVNGKIRFVRSGDRNRKVYMVKSIYDPISTILSG